MSDDVDHPIVARLRERFATDMQAVHAYRGDVTVSVTPGSLPALAAFLRDDAALAFDFLLDVTAVDFIGSAPRFELVYHLYSSRLNHRLRVKTRIPAEDPRAASLVAVWPAADWLERETWDMYGIRFEGHPDLRRIYLYEEFRGHPLRKDYPKERRQPLVGRRDVEGPQARRQEERERERYGRWQ